MIKYWYSMKHKAYNRHYVTIQVVVSCLTSKI
jgi:hypothetical protein